MNLILIMNNGAWYLEIFSSMNVNAIQLELDTCNFRYSVTDCQLGKRSEPK